MDKEPVVLDREPVVLDKEPDVLDRELVALVASECRGEGGWDLNHALACVVP